MAPPRLPFLIYGISKGIGAWNDGVYTKISNEDKLIGDNIYGMRYIFANATNLADSRNPLLTSRPVNMAVLYCIKAVEGSSLAGNLYSTEEARIGTWVDGKPLYRIVLELKSPSVDNSEQKICDLSPLNIDSVVSLNGIVNASPLNWYRDSTHYFSTRAIGHSEILMAVGHPTYTNLPVYATLEYTKTTD